MAFFIREWPNKTATLMTDNGAVLWTFSSVEEAQRVCQDWYNLQAASAEKHGSLIAPMVSTLVVA